MWPFKRKAKPIPEAEPPPKAPDSGVTLYVSDTLLKRAENIVYFIGLRGATGNYILSVHQILESYEKLDKQRATLLAEKIAANTEASFIE